MIILTLLQKIRILNWGWLEGILSPIPTISDETLNRQFLFSQISTTFLILSLFSLITNLKKEKVFGISIYKIAFAKSVLGNIIFISISVFCLLFTNIWIYITDSSSSIIFYVFLITLFLLTLFVIKIILYSNSQTLSVNKVASMYYTENIKIVRKPRIKIGAQGDFSEYLFDLNEDAIEKILKGDIEYRRNFYIYERIANLSLVNYKNKVQENYTEISSKPDIILMWVSAIEELVKNELYTEALTQYNRMISLFVIHEVYLSSFRINKFLEQILISISATDSKVIIEQNEELILNSIEVTMKYGYFGFNNDFSYTRLGKTRNLLYLQPLYGNFMLDCYNLIDKNKNFNDLEKSRKIYEYFEELRMMPWSITKYITVEIKYLEVSRELKKYNEDVYLAGIPLSNLLLLLIQEDKKGRLLYFLNDYRDNSIYLACLIVASKLATLYVRTKDDEREKKLIGEYLVWVLSKIVELDEQKIKYYCYIIKRTMGIGTTNLYSEVYLTTRNEEILNSVKQTIMLKKKGIDVEDIVFSNQELSEIVKLFFAKYDKNLLKDKQVEADQKINEKFGLLVNLL
ncbi:hypothetical protein QUF99_15015 [Bacillus sp. DX4.1]|uniref:hypothetical protein n=1 Tax=Bacillus sp. DX4.1 TaxID=3055867 RepID=UPI0025A1101E|nr:hypothetical protein [Bacillus sp. DX4.1]MDM5188579.1 hypothetical protein [Bacillus sp. DX4.1]